MKLNMIALGLVLSLIPIPNLYAAQKTVKLTTYYPAPYGEYKKLQSNENVSGKAAVGDFNADNAITNADLTAANVPDGGMAVMSSVRIGADATACTAANEGAMRYNTGIQKIEFCDGSGWQSASGGSAPYYTAWDWSATPGCSAGDTVLYSGRGFQSAWSNSGTTGDIVCADPSLFTSYSNKFYNVNSAATSYEWRNPPYCSQCSSGGENICFVKWGSSTCPTGFTAKYTGNISQSAQKDVGTTGAMICSKNADRKVFVCNGTSYLWVGPPSCAMCCAN